MAGDRDDGHAQKPSNRFMMSLRDALAQARRAPDAASGDPSEDVLPPVPAPPRGGHLTPPAPAAPPAPGTSTQRLPNEISQPEMTAMPPKDPAQPTPPPLPSAAEAARAARGEDRPRQPGPPAGAVDRGQGEPVTGLIRRPPSAAAPASEPARTTLLRGKPKIERATFNQDPVVGWVVVVGGPGLGAYRPIFEGNNTVGRSSSQRVPLDFGDDSISSEEQAYIRYDSTDRSFLFVPNLAKTNVVSINSKKPTSAVALAAMDVIHIGRTQLVFVPFCGPEFDWAELMEAKG